MPEQETKPKHADGIDTETLKQVLENIEEDRDLSPLEKETGFWFTKEMDEAQVHSDESALMKRLLCHPDFRVQYLYVSEPEADVWRRETEPTEYTGGKIVGVEGRLPVAAMKVQSGARNVSHHSALISKAVLGNDPREDDEA